MTGGVGIFVKVGVLVGGADGVMQGLFGAFLLGYCRQKSNDVVV